MRTPTRPGTVRASLRRRTAGAVAGLVAGALALSGCSVYDIPLPGGPDTGDDPMTIKVMFRDVLDLVPQSTVKVDDVTVGKVTDIRLDGYVAEVTVEVPGDLELPDNARAEIRQTSLLGEKFVSLHQPQEPGTGLLSDNDVIGLDRTGRNAEVEEVFGALSLMLNGGGVGQLKTIVSELNNTLDGREAEVKSVLSQIRLFMGQLDRNKQSIVQALENTNRLAEQLRKQQGTIESALDDIPDALRSVNRQRDDLVKLLEALERLSGVGVEVIRASKESTINSLRDLAPVLDGFAKAGEHFPRAFQVMLTYPFTDETIGRDPQVARNLHQGDFTNLDVNLDIDLADFALPEGPAVPVPDAICKAVRDARKLARQEVDRLPGLTEKQKRAVKRAVLAEIEDKDCNITANTVREYIASAVAALGEAVTEALCERRPNDPVCELLEDPGALPPVGNPDLGQGVGGALPRAGLGEGFRAAEPIDPFGLAGHGLDPGIGTMLLQGVAEVR